MTEGTYVCWQVFKLAFDLLLLHKQSHTLPSANTAEIQNRPPHALSTLGLAEGSVMQISPFHIGVVLLSSSYQQLNIISHMVHVI